jgi:hypothetical protein
VLFGESVSFRFFRREIAVVVPPAEQRADLGGATVAHAECRAIDNLPREGTNLARL